MSTKLSRFRVVGGLVAVGLAPAAWGTPADVAPGANNVALPTFSGSAPTGSILFQTSGHETENGMTVGFEEVAVSTSLDPSGVAFGFAVAANNQPTSFGITAAGFGGFMTSVQSCIPVTSPPITSCSTPTGWVSRSSGTGDTLTFSGLGTSAVNVPGQPTAFVSNVQGVSTNAPGFIHPTSFTVTDDGTTFMFEGVGPSSSSTPVPEPATLALLSLGLLGVAIGRRRRA